MTTTSVSPTRMPASISRSEGPVTARSLRLGCVGCLSAYGGSNIETVDPYNVVRRGIHWEYSEKAFPLECLGLR
jgi:hypothetical protein